MTPEEQVLRYKAQHHADKLTLAEVRRYLALGKEEQMEHYHDGPRGRIYHTHPDDSPPDGPLATAEDERRQLAEEAIPRRDSVERLAAAVSSLDAVKEALEWLEALRQERQFDNELVEVLTATIEVLQQVHGVREEQK